MSPHLPPDNPEDDEHDPRARLNYRTTQGANEWQKLVQQLTLLGIIALVGLVWKQSIAQAEMQTQLGNLTAEFSEMRSRMK